MHRQAFLFLNGEAPEPSTLKSIAQNRNALSVSADGAFYYVREYFLPSVVVADFDSARACDIPEGVEVVRLKKEKDFTDGHAALELIMERDIKHITIYGAAGGRPDHILSNYSLLALAKSRGAFAQIDAGGFVIMLKHEDFSLEASVGKTVSLVPFTDTVHIKYTKGLKYPLSDHQLDKIHILGISNVATAPKIEVGIARGEALVFLQK